MSSSEAFVTLATNDGYALGALVLAESIRKVGTNAKLVVLISNHLSDLIKQTLETSFDELVVVEELNSNDTEHLNLLSRPELGITFTKINCWLLEQYKKCVFLDSDCVVLRPIDDLFEREEFSAAPDAGWPDCFNSGVFVFQPSKETFRKLMNFASQQNASFDGGDQGLLNDFFSNWRTGDISRHLPFTYNVTANAFYSYLPAVTRFRNDIHIVHFAGAMKPWQLTYNSQNEQLSGNLSGQSDIQRDFLLFWWRTMYQNVWPKLSKFNQIGNSNDQSASHQQNYFGQYGNSLNYGNLTNNQYVESGSAAHRRAWEAGHIDYFGRDSFSNIQQQLERNIAHLPQQYHPSQSKQIPSENPATIKQSSKPLQQITNLTKPSSSSSSSSTQQVTNPVKESTTPNIVKQKIIEEIPQTTVVAQKVVNENKSTSAQQVTHSVKESTAPIIVKQKIVEEIPQTTITAQKVANENKLTSTQQVTHSVKESTTPVIVKQKTAEEIPKTTIVTQKVPNENKLTSAQQVTHSVKESTTPIIVKQKIVEETPKTTVFAPKVGNENILTSSSSHSQSTLSSSDHLSTTSHIHESNWTVKSTIVTSYSQGVGDLSTPTVISKVVSETSASSSDDIPTKTSIKQKKDITILSENDLTDNGTSSVRSLTSKQQVENRVKK